MKRIITALLCLSMLTFLFTGCTDNEQQTPDTPCTHSYSYGKCIHCNANDPSYKPTEKPDEKPGEGGGGDNTEDDTDIPSIDLDNTTELPFVPAS